jgi:hypothetical protein
MAISPIFQKFISPMLTEAGAKAAVGSERKI